MENTNLPKILLVMEDDTDESQVKHILVKYRFGNAVRRLRRAREAVRLFNDMKGREAAELPQLIIISVSDPGPMPVSATLESLRNETGDVPIVFVAATRDEEEAVRALNLSRTYCMAKPLGFFKLLEAMQKLGMYWIVLSSPP